MLLQYNLKQKWLITKVFSWEKKRQWKLETLIKNKIDDEERKT